MLANPPLEGVGILLPRASSQGLREREQLFQWLNHSWIVDPKSKERSKLIRRIGIADSCRSRSAANARLLVTRAILSRILPGMA
jgi:hypothetical protein